MPVIHVVCRGIMTCVCAGDQPHHETRKVYPGDSAVQIWRSLDGDSELECVSILRVHGSSVIHDLAWHPSCSVLPEIRLGLLAVAMADGSVQLLAVPHFSPETSTLHNAMAAGSQEPVVLDVPPVARFMAHHAEALCLIPRVLSWRPTGPKCNEAAQLLAVGFDTGDISVWDVSHIYDIKHGTEHTRPMTVLSPDSPESVRSLSWCASNPYQLCSGGQDGSIRLWNLQQPSHPIFMQLGCSP
jgi:WD40 repeat protein